MVAKLSSVVLVASLCILALVSSVHCEDVLNVEGKVFCDTCRIRFVTRISEYIEGAEVKIACHNRSTHLLTASVEGRTDETGTYNIAVTGEHEEDICEVQLLNSPRTDCNALDGERSRARVLLTKNNGIVSNIRHANPLGFFKKEALPECPIVLRELGMAG
ncbi:anther-specific protein LAT52-like [Aristolochia californica]|uniref:anther-specific protein LAT52-like n=1 Tax=Aristolochia californica TaxID=171875 RepID=UPI0035DD0A43